VAQIEVQLETPLLRVEQQLAALADALKKDDARALETAAGELHRALAAAVDHFRRAARQGGVPSALRQRLAIASAQVAAQRESLARATAALDRAIDVLMPGTGADGYAAGGQALRALHAGSAIA
jgi:hypothetical protein